MQSAGACPAPSAPGVYKDPDADSMALSQLVPVHLFP